MGREGKVKLDLKLRVPVFHFFYFITLETEDLKIIGSSKKNSLISPSKK